MAGIFDKFHKIEFFNGNLCSIYLQNGKKYNYYDNMNKDDTENKLLRSANILSDKLNKFINELKINDWKIEKCECDHYDNYNKGVCIILEESNFIIKDEKYYYANDNLKDIFE